MTDTKGTKAKLTNQWKTPNEILRLQRLKQKQKALQARLDAPQNNLLASDECDNEINSKSNETKRKNPFADSKQNITTKKLKLNESETSSTASPSLLISEDSIFHFITNQEECNRTSEAAKVTSTSKSASEIRIKKPLDFTNITKSLNNAAIYVQSNIDEEPNDDDYQKPTSYLPIDWGLKTRLRILSKTPIPGNCLKSSQEASGITNFVRCINPSSTKSTNLDTSFGSQFHQSTLYWQHPHLPWLTLFPRSTKSNGGFNIGEAERTALAKDWADSFRALYQLIRARQCPYFYVCSNTFTVLFRAAGIGGHMENHALLTPTSRGMRAALRQEEIEFTMPLKTNGTNSDAANKSTETNSETNVHSTSFSNSSDDIYNNRNNLITDENDDGNDNDNGDADDDDEDHEKWLSSLGVDADEIKKIRTIDQKQLRKIECEEDFSDQSTILIEGIECQAFFNFLLNAKSTTAKVGRLGGIPPTLLAPVAFPGATMRNLPVRFSKVRFDNVDYHSMELKGCILPHVLEYLSNLLRSTKDTFSATITSHQSTVAFNKIAQVLMDTQLATNQKKQTEANIVFGRENLSDCGLADYIVQALCRVSPDAVRGLERMCFSKEQGGFTWR